MERFLLRADTLSSSELLRSNVIRFWRVPGEYESRSLSVLKPSGYFAHILNNGWVKSHGPLLGNFWEAFNIGAG